MLVTPAGLSRFVRDSRKLRRIAGGKVSHVDVGCDNFGKSGPSLVTAGWSG